MSANETMTLDRYKGFPEGLAAVEPQNIMGVLPNSSIIEVEGRDPSLRPLYLSTLLHGNETTSFYVLRELARRWKAGQTSERSLLIFVGNVAACEQGLRVLPGQMDYNRIWSEGSTSFHDLAKKVKAIAREAKPFASIDIHNNSGMNPFYSCINYPDPSYLSLASLFDHTVVYFHNPDTVQSISFGEFCPAVTLECGKSGNAVSVEKCLNYVLSVLHLHELPELDGKKSDIQIYKTKARVKVPEEASVSFADSEQGSDFTFVSDFERLNFSELSVPFSFGWAKPGAMLEVTGEFGESVDEDVFVYRNGQVLLNQELIPSMFTMDKAVIKQDCLGYLMDRISFEKLQEEIK